MTITVSKSYLMSSRLQKESPLWTTKRNKRPNSTS